MIEDERCGSESALLLAKEGGRKNHTETRDPRTSTTDAALLPPSCKDKNKNKKRV